MAQGIYSSGESPHGHRSGSLDIMTDLEDGDLGREQDISRMLHYRLWIKPSTDAVQYRMVKVKGPKGH